MMSLVSKGPLGQLWRQYEHALHRRPVATQALTSAAMWGAGDVLAQRFAKKTVDWKRTSLTAGFGLTFVGPVGHVWYTSLVDKLAMLFGAPGTMSFLAGKIAADCTLWSGVYMSAFFLWGTLLIDGGNMEDFRKTMVQDFVPTYTAEVLAWPPIMATIFSRLPVAHHLLAVNLVTILDVAFLSIIRSGAFHIHIPGQQQPQHAQQHPEKHASDKPHKQRQQQQQQQSQQQMMLMPALASMHSSPAGLQQKPSSSSAASNQNEAREGEEAPGSSSQQVIDLWVLPQFRN